MKKLTCLLLVFAMVCSFMGITAVAEPQSVTGRYGDYNGDGVINATDALNILKVSVGKVPMDYDLMCYIDVNNDYKINASDALDILKFSVGKIRTFKASDSFTGTVNLVINNIYVQKGGTVSVGVWCQSPESFEIRYESEAKGILQLGWDSCGWLFNEQCAILNVSCLKEVEKEIVIPIKVFYVGHTSVYEIVNVHLMPEQAEPYSYGTYAGIPDMGDYMKTAPEWIETEVITSEGVEYYTTSLCYDVKTILANGNSSASYSNYVDYIATKLTYVSTGNKDGYNLHTYKNDKFTLSLWLADVEGNQKVFVYLQGKSSDV